MRYIHDNLPIPGDFLTGITGVEWNGISITLQVDYTTTRPKLLKLKMFDGRRALSVLILVLLRLIWFCSAQAFCPCQDVIVQDNKLYVEGREFFVKGIAYSPEPLSYAHLSANRRNGTGMCSSTMNVHGEFTSACYGADFYSYPLWRAYWEMDLPHIKDLGCNTVRIFSTY